LEANKPKGPNRISKINFGYLYACLGEIYQYITLFGTVNVKPIYKYIYFKPYRCWSTD